jgi:capsular exopolysaccharide synthesis family protein
VSVSSIHENSNETLTDGVGEAVVNLGVRSETHRPSAALSIPEEREMVWPETDELFRGIYTRAGLGFEPEIVAITSPAPGDGKSTISLALAIALAQDFPDRNVLLIETDVFRASLAADFDVDPVPGLVDCLVLNQSPAMASRPTFLHNLDVMPAGEVIPHSGRPLRSMQMPGLLDSLRQTYHFIILDTPALLTNSDALLLTDLADGVLVVARTGCTPADSVNKTIGQIDESKLRGVVLNGARSSTPGWLRRLMGK